jgi:hypothetical protein
MKKYTGNKSLQRLQSGQKQPKMPKTAKKWQKWPLCGLCSELLHVYFFMIQLGKLLSTSQATIWMI